VPILDDDSLARAGVNDFNGMCTGCHGAPGQDPEAMDQTSIQFAPSALYDRVSLGGFQECAASHDSY